LPLKISGAFFIIKNSIQKIFQKKHDICHIYEKKVNFDKNFHIIMKEKILAFLKTLPKLKGVQDDYLLTVAEYYSKAVTEESAIATTFNDGVVDFIKINADKLQIEGDKRVTSALKTFQEKHGLDENGQPIKVDDPLKKKKTKDVKDSDNDDVPQWALDLQKSNEELRKRLELQEQEKTATLLIDKVKKHDKLKDIPDLFFEGRNLIPKSEAEIDNLVDGLRDIYQRQVEAGVIVSIPKSSPEGNKEGSEIGKNAAKKRNENASDGVKAKAI
jgi:hypothetical protein